MSINWSRRGILKLFGATGLALAARVIGILPELKIVLPSNAQAAAPTAPPPGFNSWWTELGFGGQPEVIEGAGLDSLRATLLGRADIKGIASQSRHKNLLNEPMHAGTYKGSSGVTLSIAAIAADNQVLVYHELSKPHGHFKSAVQLIEVDAATNQGQLIALAYNGQPVEQSLSQQGSVIEAEASSCGACTYADGFTVSSCYACAWSWTCLRDYCGYQGGPCWFVCLAGPPACLACAIVWCWYWYMQGCVTRWCCQCTTCAYGTYP
jgi:hypothetical protein